MPDLRIVEQLSPAARRRQASVIYRRSLQLASGRFDMLDAGMGFSLVPWRPVIEQRLGLTLSVTI